MSKITISVRTHIKLEDIENLLDSASRGSSYWSDSEKLGYESYVKKVVSESESGIDIEDFEAEKKNPQHHILDLSKIKKGLTVMAKKQPQDFADFIKGDYDQNTGDVFLQCCLFGEVIYG